ncbi:hypothetical protein FQA47_000276 [Oryzias melastigma]|uniref:Immunoglobulin V-set domain-containing protein n=1 Tax=Oryzias melastigma TaxID=30732 RepID=A0A834C9T9_ORYME|nr:hypothetical protein FQA47_000276 [Oryzias melastigma]
MIARWWSCLFGLLCVHAEGTRWTASQSPASIRQVEINSSVEISCSTSLPSPMALSLHRFFKADAQIVYLSLSKANITKQNPREHYIDRVQVTREHLKPEYQVTLQLSKLKRDDTDLYYCSWTYFEDKEFTMEHLRSNGTVLVVGEKRPEAQCPIPTLDLVLVCAGATALILILSFCGVRLYRGRRVRTEGNFRPVPPPRTERPHRNRSCSCNSHPPHNQPYLVTSLQSPYLNR